MKSTGIVRQVDELGRIVLPKELRRTMRIEEGQPLEIFVEDSVGKIVLRRYEGRTCLFCGASENVLYFKNHFLCNSRLNDLCEGAGELSEVAITTEDPPRTVHRRRKDTSKALLTALRSNPEASQKELAGLLGLSQGRVSQLMKQLKEKTYLKA